MAYSQENLLIRHPSVSTGAKSLLDEAAADELMKHLPKK